MTTLGTMKDEIAGDLGRSDLSSYIETCIKRAIEQEQRTRYWFNVTRDLAFTTTAGTYRYSSFSSGPITNFSDVIGIDAVWLEESNGTRHELVQSSYEDIEALTDNTNSRGRPRDYAVRNNEIWLYPIPDQAYTIRVAAHYRVAAPASDTETGNPWMTHAYSVILPLAKSIIYQSRVRNYNAAKADFEMYVMRRRSLIAEGTLKNGMTRIEATEW